MNEINKRKLGILDGGIIFLISVTLLLVTNIIFGFFITPDVLASNSYFYLVGGAELVAVGIPPIIYLLAKNISIKSVFKKRITKEQAVLSAFLAVFAYPILAFLRIAWLLLLDVLKIPVLGQPIPIMDGFWIFLVAIVAISLLPGFSEEIIFRGIMQGTYQKNHKAAKAILFSSLFFMLMHGDISSFTYTFAAGIILGLVYYATGSLWASVIYHAVNNFIGVAVNYIYSIFGLGEMFNTNYEVIPRLADMAVTALILFGIAALCFGICALLFWGLTKVSKKPEQEIEETVKIKKIEYLPYIVGGFLMLFIAILPVAVEMIRR